MHWFTAEKWVVKTRREPGIKARKWRMDGLSDCYGK